MQCDFGASGASEIFRGHRGKQGPRGEDSVSLFLDVEEDTSALLQMDVVRAAEDRASRRISCSERAHTDLFECWS